MAHITYASLNASQSDHLKRLDETSFKEFSDSLKFNQDHLAHANYAPLVSKVTRAGLLEIFAKLGVAKERFESYEDLSCVDHLCFVSPHQYCDEQWCRDG
jgi:hypothetical protein